jgi:hypothetical protein
MLEHSTIFWLAGRAAEARFLGTSTETVLECGADLEEAHEYCGHLSDTGYRGGDLEEIFAEMNRRAIGLFSSSQIWDFTQSVAEALLDRGALDYEDVINATKKRKG